MNNINYEEINEKLIKKMASDRIFRLALVKESHFMFFHLYFKNYLKYPTAPFQKEIFRLTESEDQKDFFIVAFRGSAKSTIITTSYPIWSILGKQQKKFVLIISKTQEQARKHLSNIRQELEHNELLKKDLGPFKEDSDEWRNSSLIFPWVNAKIMAVSTDQGIRGFRHNEHRPDLIICDDLEDTDSVKTHESRQRLFDWFSSEVIPSGDIHNTRIVVAGNFLHDDSLMMRLKEKIDTKEREGTFRFIPLIDDNKNIAWPGKYPNLETIEKQRKQIANNHAWMREYMLKVLPREDQVIHKEWIKYYDEFPNRMNLMTFAVGIDPAISQKDTADYTAMVSGRVYIIDDVLHVYIEPPIINERLTFPETIEKIEGLYKDVYKKSRSFIDIYFEEIAYQAAGIQMLQRKGYQVEGYKSRGDKRSRLASISHLVKNGRVLFPKHGAELLISQIVNFGNEKHDDLADAFSILLGQALMKYEHKIPRITWIYNH